MSLGIRRLTAIRKSAVRLETLDFFEFFSVIMWTQIPMWLCVGLAVIYGIGWELVQFFEAFSNGEKVLNSRYNRFFQNWCFKAVYRPLNTTKSVENVKTELGICNIAGILLISISLGHFISETTVTDIITNSTHDLAKTTLV